MATTKVSLGRQTDLNASGAIITNVGSPVASTDVATKSYVDAAAVGVDWKPSVRVVATSNGTLASAYANGSVVDGVTLATGDRIALVGQTTGSENGIYTVNASGAPTRALDADTSAEVTAGMAFFVEEGTTNDNTGWVLTTNGSVVLGTTALTFVQFTGTGEVTVDTTLTKSGNQLSRAAISGDITISSGSNVSAIGANKVTLGMLATLAANSVIANPTGSAATPTAVSMVSAATASAIALRDGNANIRFNNVIEGVATSATAASTSTLTVASAKTQQFTGTTTQTVVLPDATTLAIGHTFVIANRSSGVVTVNANGGGLIQAMAANSTMTVTVISNSTAAGTWDAAYSGAGSLAASNFVDRETPAGSVNGANTTFTLTNTPVSGSESVYLNGLLQEPGAGNDYTISGATITYLTAPVSGDKIRVSYRK